MNRIAGLEAIKVPPVLAFTIDNGKNERSKRVLAQLSHISETSLHCAVFPAEKSVKEYLLANNIDMWYATLPLEDGRGSGFLSYVRHHEPSARATTLFSVQINASVKNESSVRRTANQILHDFNSKFMERINNRLYPWGPPRKHDPSLLAHATFFAQCVRQARNLREPVLPEPSFALAVD